MVCKSTTYPSRHKDGTLIRSYTLPVKCNLQRAAPVIKKSTKLCLVPFVSDCINSGPAISHICVFLLLLQFVVESSYLIFATVCEMNDIVVYS